MDSTSTQGVQLPDLRGVIKFSGVSFTYPTRPGVSVLKDVSLEVKSGQKVAIVGSSGCGKSTIVNLILRLYDPHAGKILIDGIEFKTLCLPWLRQRIGVVSQEPILFDCSIADNIRLGRENVTVEEIEAAAKLANAHEFIRKLPRNYSTVVGERGTQLFGGQKQRIAIARAMIRNPNILLLDEATSALDSESEGLVQAALEEGSKGRTTIIVAHRLSTIRNADVIIAMDNGQVAEVGSHVELMEKKSVYYQLVTLHDFKDQAATAEAQVNRSQATTGTLHMKSMEEDSRNQKDADDDVTIPSHYRILATNKAEVHFILIGLLGSILVGAVVPAFSVAFSEIIRIFHDFELTKDRPKLDSAATFWSMMYIVLGVTAALGYILSLSMFAASGERLTRRLRLAAFRNILRQDVEYFEDPKHSTGALTTTLATEATLVKAATGVRIASVLEGSITMFTGLAIAFVCGWKLTLTILACAPILVFAGFMQSRILSANQKRDSLLREETGRTVGGVIENIRTVVSLAREDKFYRDYCASLKTPHKESIKQAQAYGTAWGFSQSALFFIYGVALQFGTWLLLQGEMTAENVCRTVFAIAFSALAVGEGMSFLPDLSKAKMAAGHIFTILDSRPKIDSYAENGQRIRDVQGDISFQRVFFSYPRRQEVTVLKGIDLDIPRGQTLALVGSSGCGKSTVVSLLQRFYDVTDGQISIDGVDIRQLNVHWLRSVMSVVSQEPILFQRSIEENVQYGVDDVTAVSHDDVIEVCKQANIHDFVMSLPEQYETIVGEKGTQLSGGQKQRVAIARALLRRPRILLLDEATSALDTESEKLVQVALDVAREGRTCIIVAHRLSTIQNADAIAVVEGGRIVEVGSHQELLARRGAYFALVNRQSHVVT